MKQFSFDPFASRRARDIRNTLSKSFLQALAVKNAAVFQQCGADFLQQNIEPGYAVYVKTRMQKYAESFAIIEQQGLKEVLQQAATLWDIGLYFEMHELLELEWKGAEGDRRRALQGLIRACGMKIHAQNNNMKAAVSIGAKALEALQKYGGELRGFVRLETVLAEIERFLGAAQSTISGD